MSKENVKKFYEALGKDKALQEKSKAIGQKYAGQKLDENETESIYQKELIPMAKEAGYNFTLAELKAYAKESGKPAMRELSEEELAGVTGGNVCVCVVIGGGSFGGDSMICGGFGQSSGEYNGSEYFCLCVAGGGGGWK